MLMISKFRDSSNAYNIMNATATLAVALFLQLSAFAAIGAVAKVFLEGCPASKAAG
jgi:hypothetical protein